MKNIHFLKYIAVLAISMAGYALTSCEDEPDAFRLADGVPVIRYIRPVDVASSDSLMTGAYMDNQICLVGENLRSIYELIIRRITIIPSLSKNLISNKVLASSITINNSLNQFLRNIIVICQKLFSILR